MPCEQITPDAAIEGALKAWLDGLEAVVIRKFKYIGEACIAVARSTNSYLDRSGNLRASIGYVLIKDGRVIDRHFVGDDGVMGGEKGAKHGEAFIRRLVEQFPKGVTLVVVAGMKYAAYVSARGYDVLDSAFLTANRLMEELDEQVKF